MQIKRHDMHTAVSVILYVLEDPHDVALEGSNSAFETFLLDRVHEFRVTYY